MSLIVVVSREKDSRAKIVCENMTLELNHFTRKYIDEKARKEKLRNHMLEGVLFTLGGR